MTKNKHKIVYVEDDQDTRNLISRILNQNIFEIHSAETGLAGLSLVEQVEPDLVLMDLDLPDISGLALSTKIKATSKNEVIIIAVTGKKEFSNQEKMLIAGCDGYIPKPFDIDTFQEQIIEYLEGHKKPVPGSEQEYTISEFQIDLVNKLEEKVRALEDLNLQLGKSNELLFKKEKDVTSQNEKLIQLHEISNSIHRIKTLDEFIETMPNLITNKLGFDRCILFKFDMRKSDLRPVSWSGFQEEWLNGINLKYNQKEIEKIFESETATIISTSNDKDTPEKDIPYFNEIKKSLNSQKFLMGYIGPTKGKKILETSSAEEINQTLEKLLNNIYEKIDPENLHDELENYLASNLYKFTGFIYVDNAVSNEEITDFDNMILGTLVESSKAVYENISLIHILQSLYFKAGQDAITDPLTGISNYRYFINQFIRELNRAQRYRIPLSLAMIDIDYFKSYNDNFGHLAGDYVLRKLSHLLKENTRISDIVARYGGEEFIIILPEATKEEAHKLAEKMRSIIDNFEFLNQDKMPNANLTISCGVASYPDDGHLPEVLIENADIALYRAKNSGRNKVIVYKKDGEKTRNN
ncbi:MAG: diguanylate cyclase [Calditrichia bacterium]|nr:diguanylate cyclase [Calditrichia bacterium]